jgi:hypothetical protein
MVYHVDLLGRQSGGVSSLGSCGIASGTVEGPEAQVPSGGITDVPVEVITAQLGARLLLLAQSPFSGDIFDDLDGYRMHVNSVAGGLFEIFFQLDGGQWRVPCP